MFALNQVIKIYKEEYIFEEHPASPWMAYGQEGKKAIVYKLRKKADDSYYALKVFKETFRNPDLIANTKSLEELGDIEGLKVCKRRCITSQNNSSLIKSYPELDYALLMPWVEGSTWFDILSTKDEISFEVMIIVTQKLLVLLSKLEKDGYAHCDLSSANMIINCKIENKKIDFSELVGIEIIDVEDMYGQKYPEPSAFPKGSDGYHHLCSRSLGNGQWCKEGDRFSAAILISELLCWHNPSFRKNVFAESYFDPKEMQESQVSRYKLMLSILEEIGEPLRNCFEMAWNSVKLAECPSIVDWQMALVQSLNSLERLHSQMKKAIKNESYTEIVHLGDEIRKSSNLLSRAEWGPYTNAYYQIHIKQQLEQAINSGNELEMLSSFDKKAMAGMVDQQQLSLISVARQRVERWVPLERAIDENNDEAICELFDLALFDQSSLLSEEDKKIVEQAQKRKDSVLALRAAFQTQDPQKILQSYPANLLQNSNLLTYDDHQKLDEASQKVSKLQPSIVSLRLSDADVVLLLPDDEKEIIELWQNGKVKDDALASDVDRQKLNEAIRRQGRIVRIQRALRQKDIKRVRQLYHSNDLAHSSLFPTDMRQQVESILATP